MRIGELAAATGLSAKTLRFYEAEGLLPPAARTASGYRDYPPEHAEQVAFIRAAQAAGLKLRQIREILEIRERGEAPCRHVKALVAERLAEVDQRLADLERTRAELVAIDRRLDELRPTDCDEYCRAIR